jgi:hypothetical protein
MNAVDAVWTTFGPFVVPVALFALGVVGYAVLYTLGRLAGRD